MIAKIGFRVYLPARNFIDNQGNKFFGLHNQYDKWMPLFSPKIARLHSCAWQSIDEYKINQKVFIDDTMDPEIKENDNQVYAVFRPTLSTSKLLIDCLNLFGFEGGYDKILDLLHNESSINFGLFEDLIY